MAFDRTTYVEGLVSIIMPLYNAEKFLGSAIDSVIKQSYQNWELWIVNDASKDRSLDIAKLYAKQDIRIKIVDLERNYGSAFARNMGLLNANGEYIAFLDADDIWLDFKLDRQIDYLRICDADAVYTGYSMINSDGKSIKNRSVPSSVSFYDMLLENVVIFSSLLLKKESLNDVSFNTQFYHEDYVFSLSLLKNGSKFCGLDETLILYRISVGGKSFNKLNAAKKRWRIYRDFLNLGFIQSLYYFVNYAVHGVLKYI